MFATEEERKAYYRRIFLAKYTNDPEYRETKRACMRAYMKRKREEQKAMIASGELPAPRPRGRPRKYDAGTSPHAVVVV